MFAPKNSCHRNWRTTAIRMRTFITCYCLLMCWTNFFYQCNIFLSQDIILQVPLYHPHIFISIIDFISTRRKTPLLTICVAFQQIIFYRPLYKWAVSSKPTIFRQKSHSIYGILSHPFSGFTYFPFIFTPRCRCGPVDCPVLPTFPIY